MRESLKIMIQKMELIRNKYGTKTDVIVLKDNETLITGKDIKEIEVDIEQPSGSLKIKCFKDRNLYGYNEYICFKVQSKDELLAFSSLSDRCIIILKSGLKIEMRTKRHSDNLNTNALTKNF